MRTVKIILSFSILFLFVITSCKKNEVVITDNLPICIEEILPDGTDSTILKTIQAMVVNEEVHYWLNTDSITLMDRSLL